MGTIKELRKASGMTQSEFAKYFGININTVQNWEQGRYKCGKYVLDLMEYKLRNEKIIK